MSNYENGGEIKPLKRKSPIIITTGPEWVGIVVVIILAILAMIIVYIVLRPRIRGDSTYKIATPPSIVVTCPTSPAPTGLTAFISDVSKASFDASWNAVLIPTTSGAVVLGYNVFVSQTPGITTTNTRIAGFSPIPQVRVLNSHEGKLKFNTTYYFKVATLDTCGQSAISTQEFMIIT